MNAKKPLLQLPRFNGLRRLWRRSWRRPTAEGVCACFTGAFLSLRSWPVSRAGCVALLLPCLVGGLFAAEKPKFADISGLFPEWSNAAPATLAAPGVSGTNVTTSASTNGMDALDDKYKLAIGDRLSFRIVEDEEESPRPLIVTDSGELEVPYLGRFPAVKKSCRQLAHELKAELEKEYYYQATVILAVDVMSRGRGKVVVLGAVRAPGAQEIPRDEDLTVSKAIMNAGGFTDFADRRKVEIRRNSPTSDGKDLILIVDAKEIFEKGNKDQDLILQPGDIVFVRERLVRF